MPSSAPATLCHHGATTGTGAARVASEGRMPKLMANGTTDAGDDFSHAL